MKHLFIVIFLLVFTFLISGYSYHQKCRECQREQKENKTCMCNVGIAWRDFKEPIKHINGKAYATYRCCYGHSYLYCLTDE